MSPKALSVQARDMTKLLRGKVVKLCKRHRAQEVLVEFECGTRVFMDSTEDGLEVSITGVREHKGRKKIGKIEKRLGGRK